MHSVEVKKIAGNRNDHADAAPGAARYLTRKRSIRSPFLRMMAIFLLLILSSVSYLRSVRITTGEMLKNVVRQWTNLNDYQQQAAFEAIPTNNNMRNITTRRNNLTLFQPPPDSTLMAEKNITPDVYLFRWSGSSATSSNISTANSTQTVNPFLKSVSTNTRNIELESMKHNHSNSRSIPSYTQDDIISFLRIHASKRAWHVLVFEPHPPPPIVFTNSDPETRHSSNNMVNQTQFHPRLRLYSMSTNPKASTNCPHCREHLLELLTDALRVVARRSRHRRRDAMSNTTMHVSRHWQLLMDVARDSVHLAECHNTKNNNTNTSACSRYPPVITSGSISKMALMETPFLYQLPIRYYNECLYHWRQRQRGNEKGASSIKGSDCHLQHEIRNFPATSTAWSSLIPQVYWRGTAMAMLPEWVEFAHYQRCEEIAKRHPLLLDGPTNSINVTRRSDCRDTNNTSANGELIDKLTKTANALFQESSKLTPRCLAVAMSLQARAEWLQQQRQPFQNRSSHGSIRPWINIQFTRHKINHKIFESQGYDCVLGDYTSPLHMARYKYQIDLGGNGGTTWLGTITKLAMPGLLFHHETPAKDWFYNDLQPWVHYVPIQTNLYNLYDMFVWAETHPHEAEQIAQRGQEFARQLVTEDQFATTIQHWHIQPLHAIATAYTPSSVEETIDSILRQYEAGGVYSNLVASCSEVQCEFQAGPSKNRNTA